MVKSSAKSGGKKGQAAKRAFRILGGGSSSSDEVLSTLTVLSNSASATEQKILDEAKRIVEANRDKTQAETKSAA